MTPEFAKGIDPIFLYVFGLVDRVERGEQPAPEEERVRIRGLVDQAEAIWGHTPDAELAKYAVVSWIDEMLIIEVPWQGSEWWKNNALEWEYFKTQDRSEQFYLKAREASGLRKKDALEAFYICVVMGFRGLYRDPNRAAALTEALQLPADLETWARQTSMAIQLRLGRPPISEVSVPIEGAPPLNGPFSLIWASVAGLVLSVLTGLLCALFWFK
ncbi:MAG: DotU family type IV/VI secretion system protein [Thermoguttaceae bacterium]